jgi:kynurenine formamidase
MHEPYIDLTLPIWDGMRYNPVHFPPEITLFHTIESDTWESRRLVFSSHLGTHLDAPRHFIPGGASVDELDLDCLVGVYQVVPLNGQGKDSRISAEDLPSELSARVLIATGWSETHLNTPEYFDAPPVLDLSAAGRLVDSGTRIVGIDGPTVDLDGDVHRALLGSGCLIVENLTNLTRLGTLADTIVLPLPVRDGDGSPVRAIGRRVNHSGS